MTVEVVTDYATRVLAANPGPMTLDGTNTWILHAPRASTAVVVDPGPLLTDHLQTVLDVVASYGGTVSVVLLTHGHHDHSEGAAWFASHAGCGVRSVDPAFRVGGRVGGLADGEVISAGDLRIEVLATPGHTRDSVCFWLPQDGSLLTGDTVLGRGTSVVAHPDGALGPYLDTLERLSGFSASSGVQRLLPGHGPVIDDPAGVLAFYLQHRQERLDQVRAAMAAGAVTPQEVVERVYADVDPILWPAAERSVRAQLDYLTTHP